VAGELPELVSVLRTRLGEVDGIEINWSATEGASDLRSVAMEPAAPVGLHRRPRVMWVRGARSSAKLLVIPSLTSVEFGTLVLKVAAGLPIRGSDDSGEGTRQAQRVVVAARAESLSWTHRGCDAGTG